MPASVQFQWRDQDSAVVFAGVPAEESVGSAARLGVWVTLWRVCHEGLVNRHAALFDSARASLAPVTVGAGAKAYEVRTWRVIQMVTGPASLWGAAGRSNSPQSAMRPRPFLTVLIPGGSTISYDVTPTQPASTEHMRPNCLMQINAEAVCVLLLSAFGIMAQSATPRAVLGALASGHLL